MKNFIICLLTLSAILLPLQTARAEIKKEAGFISLNVTHTKEVEPNKAEISFAVETIDEDSQKATLKNNETTTKIINALKEKNIQEYATIKTNKFSLQPNYAKTLNGTRIIKNYTAINSITVTTKDIKKVSNIIDYAIKNGANKTNNLTYSYEDENGTCKNIYQELIKGLNEEANTIATALGTTLDGIKHVNASCNVDRAISNGRMYEAKVLASAGTTDELAPSTPIEAGKIKIRVYINAEYYVK